MRLQSVALALALAAVPSSAHRMRGAHGGSEGHHPVRAAPQRQSGGLSELSASFPEVNDRPIIGILTLPNDVQGNARSYFPASYVKWIESGGGRVVPIPYTDPLPQIAALAANVNGFLFTGGGADFFNPDGSLTQFAAAAQVLFNTSVGSPQAGEWVPLWGTCLGFQLTLSLAAMNASILTNGFDSENVSWPFIPTAAASSSLLFGTMPSDAYSILTTQNVTMNSHQAGIAPADFNANKAVVTRFSMLGVGYDREGRPFVSATEALNGPVFATQFHSEKPLFEWYAEEEINHSSDSVYANGWFNRFFVAQARKNARAFPSPAAEEAALIYNYSPVYTGDISTFEQCYFFD